MALVPMEFDNGTAIYCGEVDCGAITANNYVEVEIPRYGRFLNVTPRGWTNPAEVSVIIKTYTNDKWFLRVFSTIAYSAGTIFLQWMQITPPS